MPIFLALFRVLDGAARIDPATGQPIARGYWLEQNPDLVESLNQATIFGAKISDTFLKVPFTDGITSVHVVTVVLIIAMTVTLFITQLQLMRKNMPPEALTGPFAQQQKIMLYAFPVIFAIGGINFPVGVLIYWFTSNLWTMAPAVLRHSPQPRPGHAGVRRVGRAASGPRQAEDHPRGSRAGDQWREAVEPGAGGQWVGRRRHAATGGSAAAT